MSNKALGKGLSALIPEKLQDKNLSEVGVLDIEKISNNSQQPRTNYDAQRLKELVASIKEKGVLQPIVVRPQGEGYEVIAGERRLRAARTLNFKEVPVVIKEVSDQEALVISIVENIQREELNPIEEAEAYKKLIENFQFTQDVVAQSVGKNRSTIGNLLRLLNLPEHIKKSVYTQEISAGHARALLSIEDSSTRNDFYKQTLKKQWSVRDLEKKIKLYVCEEGVLEKKISAVNPQVVEVEQGLQKLLGTKVKITSNKKSGKIVIDYYSLVDLNRIVKAMIK